MVEDCLFSNGIFNVVRDVDIDEEFGLPFTTFNLSWVVGIKIINAVSLNVFLRLLDDEFKIQFNCTWLIKIVILNDNTNKIIHICLQHTFCKNMLSVGENIDIEQTSNGQGYLKKTKLKISLTPLLFPLYNFNGDASGKNLVHFFCHENMTFDFMKVGPLGLINYGHTCAINSVLQCLFHIPIFRKLIYSIPPLHLGQNSKSTTRSAAERTCHGLQRVFYRLQCWKDCFFPDDFLSALPLTHDFYTNARQHDVFEVFFSTFLVVREHLAETVSSRVFDDLFGCRTCTIDTSVHRYRHRPLSLAERMGTAHGSSLSSSSFFSSSSSFASSSDSAGPSSSPPPLSSSSSSSSSSSTPFSSSAIDVLKTPFAFYTQRIEKHFALIVPVEGHISLKTSLASLFARSDVLPEAGSVGEGEIKREEEGNVEGGGGEGMVDGAEGEVHIEKYSRTVFATLPPVLFFQLSRYVFDTHTHTPHKIFSRFEYPAVLHLDGYVDPSLKGMKEGLYSYTCPVSSFPSSSFASSSSSSTSSFSSSSTTRTSSSTFSSSAISSFSSSSTVTTPSSISSSSTTTTPTTTTPCTSPYVLCAVLAHTGDVGEGHYTAFFQDCGAALERGVVQTGLSRHSASSSSTSSSSSSSPLFSSSSSSTSSSSSSSPFLSGHTPTGQWWMADDTKVVRVPAEVPLEWCAGIAHGHKQEDGRKLPTAYMLMYVRTDAVESVYGKCGLEDVPQWLREETK